MILVGFYLYPAVYEKIVSPLFMENLFALNHSFISVSSSFAILNILLLFLLKNKFVSSANITGSKNLDKHGRTNIIL